MRSLPTVGFAALADLVYDDSRTQWAGFARQNVSRNEADGFHASLYVASADGRSQHVLSFAGTEINGGIAGNPDVAADVGFGGPGMGKGTNVFLLAQAAKAFAFTELARKKAQNEPLILCGHSLGGGLAQIAAAYSGLPAVTFSSPAVTAVPGVAEAHRKSKAKVVNILVKNDPINLTGLKGTWLGLVVLLLSRRTGGDAHKMDETLAELSPKGQFAITGAKDPFTLPAGGVSN